jgi:hypothetical protein
MRWIGFAAAPLVDPMVRLINDRGYQFRSAASMR